jgi:hypothetical protein
MAILTVSLFLSSSSFSVTLHSSSRVLLVLTLFRSLSAADYANSQLVHNADPDVFDQRRNTIPLAPTYYPPSSSSSSSAKANTTTQRFSSRQQQHHSNSNNKNATPYYSAFTQPILNRVFSFLTTDDLFRMVRSFVSFFVQFSFLCHSRFRLCFSPSLPLSLSPSLPLSLSPCPLLSG